MNEHWCNLSYMNRLTKYDAGHIFFNSSFWCKINFTSQLSWKSCFCGLISKYIFHLWQIASNTMRVPDMNSFGIRLVNLLMIVYSSDIDFVGIYFHQSNYISITSFEFTSNANSEWPRFKAHQGQESWKCDQIAFQYY